MRKFNQESIADLTFEDFDVEKMEFFREKKVLRIFVQGAWMSPDEHGINTLGKGILFFSDWESITITIYDVCTNTLSVLEGPNVPSLEDLCEVIFSDQLVSLRGFGFKSGWMEWNLVKPQMQAEFEEYRDEG